MRLTKIRWSELLDKVQRSAIPLVALLLIGLIYFLGIRSERTGFVSEVLDPGFKRITHPVLNAFRRKPPEVQQLRLELDSAGSDSLERTKGRVLELGWLDAADNVRLSVIATSDERSAPGVLSLHEGPVDRSLGKRWPFLVILPHTDSLLNVRAFDMVPVHDAVPINGKLLQLALQDLGLPVPDQALVDLSINDDELGLYLLEGRADSLWIDRHGLAHAAVLRFDDALRISAKRNIAEFVYPIDPELRSEWLSAPILTSQPSGGRQANEVMRRTKQAVEQLEEFRMGTRPASAVFDALSAAKLLALCDVLGAQATIQWWNLRFLPDSASGKSILFPQRLLAGTPISSILALREPAPWNPFPPPTDLAGRLLADPDVYALYIKWLNILSEPNWVRDLEQRNMAELDRWQRIIRGEFPSAELDRAAMAHCAAVAQRTLHPREPVLGYTQFSEGAQTWVAVSNVHDLPIAVLATIQGTDTMRLTRPLVIRPRQRDKPLSYARLQPTTPVNPDLPLMLLVTVVGLESPITVPAKVRSTFIADR